jgi:plasmid stability protein
MRTTLRLDDDLVRDLKAIAAESGRTLGQVVEDALRQALRTRRAPDREAVELPLFHGTGTLPGVDLVDSAALLDLMDEGRRDPP